MNREKVDMNAVAGAAEPAGSMAPVFPAGQLSGLPLLPVYEKKLFIFDMGNVVVKNIHVLGPVAEEWGLPMEEFLADYRQYDFPLMDGTIPTSEYWVHIEKKFGVKVEGEPFAKHFSPVMNPPMVALLKRLRKSGKRVVCGSNTFAPHWDILADMGFLELFDAVYPSHELGMSKPARQYFQFILDHEGMTAAQTFFVDDFPENIEAAEKMGIATLQYADGPLSTGEELTADQKLFRVFGAVD